MLLFKKQTKLSKLPIVCYMQNEVHHRGKPHQRYLLDRGSMSFGFYEKLPYPQDTGIKGHTKCFEKYNF